MRLSTVLSIISRDTIGSNRHSVPLVSRAVPLSTSEANRYFSLFILHIHRPFKATTTLVSYLFICTDSSYN